MKSTSVDLLEKRLGDDPERRLAHDRLGSSEIWLFLLVFCKKKRHLYLADDACSKRRSESLCLTKGKTSATVYQATLPRHP